MRVLISTMVSLALAVGMYLVFLRKVSGAGGSPKATIAATTVQVQLLNIAQAERIYYVENNAYGTLENLASTGTFKLKTPDPDGYTYLVEVSASGFKATARHAEVKGEKAENYPVISVDQTMQVQRSN